MIIIDYLKWRGDLSFKQDSFNEVDNLCLCHMSYTMFDDLIDTNTVITIKELADLFFARHSEEEIKAKLENGKITLKVELENYEGVVKVTVINDEINYYFVNEKTNIVINIIKNKKNLNFTNKNLNSFVY